MPYFDYVILYYDENCWQKSIVTGETAKKQFLDDNQETSPFVKRFLDSGRVDNLFFDSYEEAELSSKKTGGQVHPAPPPKTFSDKTTDIEFYYQDP